ncbi:MAG TPA: hypothetical protein VH724_08010 [Candidatus Angelobacter sp.]|nr:hypothetical protein [Candidatus Angelobacter sp.]
MRIPRLMIAFAVVGILASLPLCVPAQTSSSGDVFTIAVAPPVSPRDVQVRYFLSGDPAVQQSSSIAKPDDEKIVVKTGVEGVPAKGFRAIVFAPGCQFATIKADDLASSNRQAPFECQKLSTTALHGRTDISRFGGKELQVSAVYVCNWAGQFFGVRGMSISPFAVGKAKVENDGAFAVEVPDFSGDPLWTSLSHNATLMFFLVDAQTGQQVARLSAPRDISQRGSLKVATSYPAEILFSVR